MQASYIYVHACLTPPRLQTTGAATRGARGEGGGRVCPPAGGGGHVQRRGDRSEPSPRLAGVFEAELGGLLGSQLEPGEC
jgi:hypothetical protein